MKDVAEVKDKRKKSPVKKKEKTLIEKVFKDENPVEDPFDVLKFVLMTEKSVQNIEAQNKLVFIVNRKSDKKKIKEAVKNAFEVDVKSVTTTIDQKGRKKAFIKFKEEGAAGEIAIRLGII